MRENISHIKRNDLGCRLVNTLAYLQSLCREAFFLREIDPPAEEPLYVHVYEQRKRTRAP